VAVIEVVLSRRSERRWRILAQTALIELAEAANTTWSTLAEVLDLQGACCCVEHRDSNMSDEFFNP
jgi:hypothetical protein